MFKSGLSLETNNASLIKSLKGFDSYVKIEKSSNEPKQWPLTADFLLLLTPLLVNADRLKWMLSRPDIKMTFSLTIISNVAITTQKFVNYMGTKFFGNAVFKSKKVTQAIFRLENNFDVTLG